MVVGSKTDSVFFTRMDPATRVNAVYKADTNTGAIRKLIDLPPRVSISSVNADETLGAGTYNEADCPGGDPNAPNAFLAARAAVWLPRQQPAPRPDPLQPRMQPPQTQSWAAPTYSPTTRAR